MKAKSKGRGGRRQGAGRSPKAPGEKLANRVTVLLTNGELEALRATAGDRPLGTVARELVLRWVARARK